MEEYMIVLKWYSIIIIVVALIMAIYRNGKENKCIETFISLFLYLPIIIFLISV